MAVASQEGRPIRGLKEENVKAKLAVLAACLTMLMAGCSLPVSDTQAEV